MTATTEIGTVGERYVAYWLRYNGYATNIDTKGPGATDIEARGSTKSLLVQVKTAVLPSKPDTLSAEEERSILARAARLGCEAWEARVQLDVRMQQVGQVQWRRMV